MSNPVPFVYLSKDENELRDLLLGVKTPGTVSKNTFVFDPTTDNNFISVEDTLLNSKYQTELVLVDPQGEFEKEFLGADSGGVALAGVEGAEYLLGIRDYYIAYGVGSDYQNISPIKKVNLFKSTIDIKKGRRITLTFVENQSLAVKGSELGKYSSNSPAHYTGYSAPVAKFTFDSITEGLGGYNLQDAVLDSIVESLKIKYSTPNVILLLPDLDLYLKPSLQGETYSIFKTQDTTAIYTRLLDSIGLGLSREYVDLEFRDAVNFILNNHARENGLPTPDPFIGLTSKVSCSVIEYLDYDVAACIDRINGLGDKPPIKWVEYVETDLTMVKAFTKGLLSSPILGGSLTSKDSINLQNPLIICGDSDLIADFLYDNQQQYSKSKKPRHGYLKILSSLKETTKWRDARYPKHTLTSTTYPFFRGTSTTSGTGVVLEPAAGIGTQITLDTFKPTFQYGGSKANLRDIVITENPFYFAQLLSHVKSTFNQKELLKVLEILGSRNVVQQELFVGSLAIYLNTPGTTALEVKELIDYYSGEEVPVEIAKSLANLIFSTQTLTGRGNEPIGDLSIESLIDKLSNTSDFLNILSKQTYQVTVKSLPFFLKSSLKDIASTVGLVVEEPKLTGSTDNEILSDSSFYNGDYFLMGYRHRISGTDMFSEFKLIKQKGLADRLSQIRVLPEGHHHVDPTEETTGFDLFKEAAGLFLGVKAFESGMERVQYRPYTPSEVEPK